MHVRPYMDLRNPVEVDLVRTMMIEVTDLLIAHQGSLSGEHGDGLIRSWLNRRLFGEKIYKAFCELKSAFDPTDIMNPGKIVEGPPLEENLKVSPETHWQKIDTFLDFSQEGGFELSVDLCNGNGQCRKGDGLMCPSFQATHDEYDSTRARAQALRGIIHGKLPKETLSSKEIYDVLDLCLECKGCKTECPSQVDMAKMKAETLYHHHQKEGLSLRTSLLGHMEKWLKRGSHFAGFSNWIADSKFLKQILSWIGISKKRNLPKLASQRFSEWFATKPRFQSELKVVLFNDTYTEFLYPEIGIAAVNVLEQMGFEVEIAERLCCGRPLMSKGILDEAKRKASALVDHLYTYTIKGLPIIFLEPSCLSMIQDDFSGLLGYLHEKRQAVSGSSLNFETFLLLNKEKIPPQMLEMKASILLHGHCHQKSSEGTKVFHEVFKLFPQVNLKEIPSGCCGMAGSFGYESEHHDISMKIGELKLFPAIRSADENTWILANGFSCRTQIHDGTGRSARHIAQILSSL